MRSGKEKMFTCLNASAPMWRINFDEAQLWPAKIHGDLHPSPSITLGAAHVYNHLLPLVQCVVRAVDAHTIYAGPNQAAHKFGFLRSFRRQRGHDADGALLEDSLSKKRVCIARQKALAARESTLARSWWSRIIATSQRPERCEDCI
jgi:hypothetical protein